jgi:hypothetical protein
VVTAVTTELERGQVTGPSCAARVAAALRGLQTPRGALPDPEAGETRPLFEEWRAARSVRRSSPNLG